LRNGTWSFERVRREVLTLDEVLGEETLDQWMTQSAEDNQAEDDAVAGDEALGLAEAQAAGVDLADDVLDIFETEELEDEALSAMASSLQDIDANALLELCRDVAGKLEENRPPEEPGAAS
jgi:hypothetical protein